MHDANLLRCEPIKSTTSERVIDVIPFDLTWDGHEFLDKIRDKYLWQKTKNVISSKGGSLAFSVINQLVTKYATESAFR